MSETAAMNPAEILQKLQEKYTGCHSYCDSGIAEFTDVKGNKEQIEFRTELVRPDYFKFEWQEYGPRRGKSENFSALRTAGSKTFVSRQHDHEEELPDLSMAVAAATGSSAGVAQIVPGLLFEAVRQGSKHLLQLTDLLLVGEETLESTACFVLSGTLFKNRDHTLWIACSDFSLRRVNVDRSRTSSELEKEHKALLANTELMTQLAARGITPPSELKHADTKSISNYIYNMVIFDTSIAHSPQRV